MVQARQRFTVTGRTKPLQKVVPAALMVSFLFFVFVYTYIYQSVFISPGTAEVF